jgi:L-ascorbate metabolism protein UlaG (beta-lactamase superfamily)
LAGSRAVLGPLRHIGSGLAYLATARRQQRSDHETAAQLAWPGRTSPLPPGLTLTWLGTAGFRLAYQDTVLWIDPYVTRLSKADFALRRTIPSSDALVERYVDRADAILVGHTHFDHALDVPTIARRTGCQVYGSSSLAHLMALFGAADQAVVVEPKRSYEVGPFRFHFVPSIHSKLQLGLGVPYSGELTCDHVDALIPQAYKCGQVWGIAIEVAGTRFYHQGSADLLESEVIDRDVDIFLCGISGRRFTPRYIERALHAFSPKLVIASHYDDFFRPLDAGIAMSFNVNLTGFADEAHAASRDVPVYTLEINKPV